MAQKLADTINTPGASVAGVIHALAWASGSTSRYGKLANLDRAFPTHGRTLGGVFRAWSRTTWKCTGIRSRDGQTPNMALISFINR